jgi:hypothetical protein
MHDGPFAFEDVTRARSMSYPSTALGDATNSVKVTLTEESGNKESARATIGEPAIMNRVSATMFAIRYRAIAVSVLVFFTVIVAVIVFGT